jgi:hypothetical protein
MKTGPYVPSDEQIGGLNGLYKQKVKDVLEIEEKWGKKLDEIDEKVSSGKR